jgi:Interleukin-like EMT inducer
LGRALLITNAMSLPYFFNALCSAECLIETMAWGSNDTSMLNGYIAINGNRVFSTASGPCRGFNIVQLNVNSCLMSDVGLRSFDTSVSTTASDAMATYINSLPLNTVLIGITSDEPQTALTQNAKSALLAIGVNVTGLQFRGKVSFVAQIGRPTMTISKVAFSGGASLQITLNVTGMIKY